MKAVEPEDNLEKLDKILGELREDKRIKIVEGEKDKRALAHFGIGNIKMIHGKSLARLTGGIKQDVIMLTDYDRTGGLLARKTADLLKNESVHVDMNYRRELRRYAKIKYIEELVVKYDKLLEKIRRNSDGKNLHRYGKVCNLRSLRDRRGGGETGRGRSSVRAD